MKIESTIKGWMVLGSNCGKNRLSRNTKFLVRSPIPFCNMKAIFFKSNFFKILKQNQITKKCKNKINNSNSKIFQKIF
jgi:hypothetical protein